VLHRIHTPNLKDLSFSGAHNSFNNIFEEAGFGNGPVFPFK
jgi:hypothetical protein